MQNRGKDDIFDYDAGETLERFAQRAGRCPIPGNIHGQAG